MSKTYNCALHGKRQESEDQKGAPDSYVRLDCGCFVPRITGYTEKFEPEPVVSTLNQTQQIAHFANDLEALVNRYRSEYDLPLACYVGVLEIQKSHLIIEEHNA